MIIECKICRKLIKRSEVINKVYPKDFDFDCCNECNNKAFNEDSPKGEL